MVSHFSGPGDHCKTMWTFLQEDITEYLLEKEEKERMEGRREERNKLGKLDKS